MHASGNTKETFGTGILPTLNMQPSRKWTASVLHKLNEEIAARKSNPKKEKQQYSNRSHPKGADEQRHGWTLLLWTYHHIRTASWTHFLAH
jgi:hypothetical protein